MKVLELFSGTGSFSHVCEMNGHEVFTIDNNPEFKPSLCMDVFDVTPELIQEKFGQPDVIWASPPCQCFSIMVVSKNWQKLPDGTYKTKRPEVDDAIRLVKHTLWLIGQLKPKYWFIENPRAMLRKQDFMPNDKRKTVTYCQYGLPYQKATDIWTNLDSWKPKAVCSARNPCHQRVPRGSRFGVQGIDGFRENREQKHPQDCSRLRNVHYTFKSGHVDFMKANEWDGSARTRRGIVPVKLCEEIYQEIIRNLGEEAKA